jgi:hypothetical protein
VKIECVHFATYKPAAVGVNEFEKMPQNSNLNSIDAILALMKENLHTKISRIKLLG